MLWHLTKTVATIKGTQYDGEHFLLCPLEVGISNLGLETVHTNCYFLT
jgi:hypothetical protein